MLFPLLAALPAMAFPPFHCADSAASLADSLRAGVSELWEWDGEPTCGQDSVFDLDPEKVRPDPSPKVQSTMAYAQPQNHAPQSRFRHGTRSENWTSRLELRNDTVSRLQVGFHRQAWQVKAGNIEDSAMPLRPLWMPRRNLPRSWMPAEEHIPGLGSASPARIGARYGFRGIHAYALRAFGALRPSGSPKEEASWSLRHAAGGIESSLLGRPSLHFGETRVSREGKDSLAEHWTAFGLATPGKGLEINSAWSGSRQNPDGGYALGTKAQRFFGNGGLGEIVFRQRGPRWISVWDPGWMEAKDSDSLSPRWGAGEFALRLRLPVAAQSFLEGEGWQTWAAEGKTRRAGMRGRAWTRQRGFALEMRGAHWQSLTYDGNAIFRGSLAWRAQVGERLKWEWQARRDWGPGSNRRQAGIGLDWEWLRSRWKSGVLAQTDAADSLQGSLFLSSRVRITRNWSLEAQGTTRLPSPSPQYNEWKMVLRYAGH